MNDKTLTQGHRFDGAAVDHARDVHGSPGHSPHQYALITGASSGIGEALLRQFAQHGHNVIAVGKDAAALAATLQALKAAHPDIRIVPIAKNLMREKACQELYQEIAARGLEVEYLVHDAGQGQEGHFVDVPIERDVELIRLNVEAATRLIKAFLPAMVARNRGRILNVDSVAAFQPGPMPTVYHATKAFLVSFCEGLAEELKDTGVTVTCLCPAANEADLFDRTGMDDPRVVKYKNQRMMIPEAVADAAYEAMMHGARVVHSSMINKILTFSRRVMSLARGEKGTKPDYYEGGEKAAS